MALEQLPIPLLEWYRDNARSLPWREDPTPYHVWLSEIMLQQTRVAAVISYYNRFLEECPDVKSLAELPEERLMKLWQGLGYYNRARNRQIMEEHGGEFPSDYDRVRALKGVGDYTAGAICSIAFGQPVPAVDGNVLRVVARITGDAGDITTQTMKKRVTELLEPIIPLQSAGAFTQAMMELGATVCLPNGAPLCERCPAREFCAARLEDRVDELPGKGKKKARRVEERQVWLIFCKDKVVLRQRPSKGLLAGLWEYPDMLPEGVQVDEESFGCTAKHIFTHVEWHMTARMAEVTECELPEGWVWADRCEWKHRYAIPNAFDGMAHLVEERLNRER